MTAIYTMTLLMNITAPAPILHGLVVGVHFAVLDRALEQDDHATFDRVYAAILKAGQQRRLFDFVAARLEKSSNTMRHTLIYCIRDFPDRAKEAAPLLRRIADDLKADYQNRVVAVRMLTFTGDSSRQTLDVLLRCLHHKPAIPKPNPAVGAGVNLRVAFPDVSAELRSAACLALWKLEKKTEVIAPTLLEILVSHESWDKRVAIKTIGEIGPDLKEMVGPELMKLMYSDVRIDVYPLVPAFASKPEIAAQELAKALVEANESQTKMTEDFHAGRTKLTLQQFGFASRCGRKEISLAAYTLASLGEAAIPEIVKLLQQQDRDARSAGLFALRKMVMAKNVKDAMKAREDVKKLLNDPDENIKAAAEALLKELSSK